MTQSFKMNILCLNKQVDTFIKFYQGILLKSETYICRKVECLKSCVYCYNIEYYFSLKTAIFQSFINNIDQYLIFTIEVE